MAAGGGPRPLAARTAWTAGRSARAPCMCPEDRAEQAECTCTEARWAAALT
jgi:hypothetical protein